MPARRVSAAVASIPSLATADPPRAAAGDRFLRAREVCARVGLSRTTIWRAVRRGDFPAPRRLTANTIGWLASEVEAWMTSRVPTRAA